MPNATLIHAACFAVGAAVGAGAVAAVGISRRPQPAQAIGVPPVTDPRSIVKFGSTGLPELAATALQIPGTVLKYGNPGTPGSNFNCRLAQLKYVLFLCRAHL